MKRLKMLTYYLYAALFTVACLALNSDPYF